MLPFVVAVIPGPSAENGWLLMVAFITGVGSLLCLVHPETTKTATMQVVSIFFIFIPCEGVKLIVFTKSVEQISVHISCNPQVFHIMVEFILSSFLTFAPSLWK